MKAAAYPPFTIIMRGYRQAEAEAILQAASAYRGMFAAEITLNTPDALGQIRQWREIYGSGLPIGAGTVRTVEEARQAVEAGAQFLLGPHMFSSEMIAFAKKNDVIAIPAAMTPSEIDRMFRRGADIVKVFPAAVLTPRFFKDVQAPFGRIPLMAVGGISVKNARDYLDQGASYLGLGSNLFETEAREACGVARLSKSLQRLVMAAEEHALETEGELDGVVSR